MKLFSLLGNEDAGRGFFLVTPANVQVQDLDLVKWDTPYNTDIKPLMAYPSDQVMPGWE